MNKLVTFLLIHRWIQQAPDPNVTSFAKGLFQWTRNSDIWNDNLDQKLKPTKKSRHKYSSLYLSVSLIYISGQCIRHCSPYKATPLAEGEWNRRPIRVNLTFDGLELTSNPGKRLVPMLHFSPYLMTEGYRSRYQKYRVHWSIHSPTSIPGPSRWDPGRRPWWNSFCRSKILGKISHAQWDTTVFNCVAIRLCRTAHAIFSPKFWNDKMNFTRVFVTVSPPWDRGCSQCCKK